GRCRNLQWGRQEGVVATSVAVIPHNLPGVVDAREKTTLHLEVENRPGSGIVESGELAAAQQEAMPDAVGIGIASHDVAESIDAVRKGSQIEARHANGSGVVDCGVLAAAQQKGVVGGVGVIVRPDNLPGVVDPGSDGA